MLDPLVDVARCALQAGEEVDGILELRVEISTQARGPRILELLPHAAERLADRFADCVQARVGDQRQHQLRAGQRRRAQQRVDLGAQTAAVDEHQPLAEHWVLVGNCMAMPPPSEWPTTVARRWPSTISRSRRLTAKAPSE